MGAYLSVPVTEKVSTDAIGKQLSYGACSMQGWRVSQEDAHNAIIDFDEDSHLFAVYDGHGGHEVAAYTANKLPEFIKATDAYKKMDGSLMEECLKNAFLAFDATLVKPDIVNNLKQIAGTKDDDEESESEEEVDNLYREATMPLDEVMAKYAENPHLARCMKEKKGVSPFLRAKGESHSDEAPIKFEMEGESSSSKDEEEEDDDDSNKEKECPNGTAEPHSSSQINGGEVKHVNGELDQVTSEESKNDEENTEVKEEINSDVENGEVTVNGEEEGQEFGKGKGSKGMKGVKGKSILKNSEVQALKVVQWKEKKRQAAVKAAEIYRRLQEGGSENELSDDDSEDEDDNFEDEVEEEDEEGEESEDDDEEVEDEDDPYTEFAMNMKEEPGFDSGCTACLALIRGSELYVANVGDSRIVVCRDGKAIDMSIDHKPEDDSESARIIKAGGRVTEDGRVNGGLNLSRAIGDHGYKQNKNFSPEDQMISPLPDVRSMTLTPEDHFMIVACDGIWNSLSSQEACDFVSEKLAQDKKLSTICEDLFDHCLAPDTLGDGTGCDNMTCIIVTFSNSNKGSAKRTSEEAGNEDLRQDDKKLKCDDK